ncbi:hypothetical protein HU200_048543 [Digitaria exilis]|uniref:F-box domain-containing protein n=1 Tax=Digitaria exilis TaxID=1010633 RepID=A0A835B0S7_9POAL|nr:hypothetical protein HU200_048543 [Digitaria exilis]
MASAGAVVDRISALPNDLLHSILTLVREATAVTRTAALSRRWRRVWIHARQLDLLDSKLKRGAVPGHFVGFVDWVLAQRGETGMGSLNINMSRDNTGASPSPESVNEWLRYATQHEVDDDDEPAVVLPDHGRMTYMKLSLSRQNMFQLPVAAGAKYEALTVLRLWRATFFGAGPRLGDDVLLGDFVSSCCPRLRKLAIGSPLDLRELVLRVDALQELRLSRAEDLRTLDVTAPNLRVLWLDLDRVSGNRVACCRVVAPRLQVIGMRDATLAKLPGMDIHDLASVRCLDLCLHMRGWCCRRTSSGLWLLENCPGVQHVQVSLSHYCGLVVTLTGRLFVGLGTIFAADEFIGLGRKGAAPFASVTSLKVDTTSLPESYLVPSITSLLLRFPRLTSLSISSNRQVSWLKLKKNVHRTAYFYCFFFQTHTRRI